MRPAAALLIGLAALASAAQAAASECDTPAAEWLFCEDFEDGGLGWSDWFAQSPFVECLGCNGGVNDPARIALSNDPGNVHDGTWALAMPAAASANYVGASLAYRSCAGAKQQNCTLTNHDQLYYRAWVKLAADHQYVHHFMSIGGTRPDGYWDGDGTAGCRPTGDSHCGTTLDFNQSHELFFYTYYPEMSCDPPEAGGGYCAAMQPQLCDDCAARGMPCSDGPECCWGNLFSSDPRPVLARDRWVCLEMMLKLNAVGQSDGEMAFWVDGQLGHRQTSMHFRDVAELGLNKIWVQHYIADGDATQSNRIWWDDIIASTARIGCAAAPVDGGSVPDAATASDRVSASDRASADDAAQPGDAAAVPDAAAASDRSEGRDSALRPAADGGAVRTGTVDGCRCSSTRGGPVAAALVGAVAIGGRWWRRRYGAGAVKKS